MYAGFKVFLNFFFSFMAGSDSALNVRGNEERPFVIQFFTVLT